MNAEQHTVRQTRLTALRAALDEGAVRAVQRLLATLHPAEIARLLESLPPTRREIAWELTDPGMSGDVLLELSDDVRDELVQEMDAEELVAAAEDMEVDDFADFMSALPETVTQQVLRSMDQQDRERLSRALSWPDDSAGALMSTDTVSVRADVSIEVVQRYLRMRGELPERTDRLFVVDRNDRFMGTILLASLLTVDLDADVGANLDTEAPRIAPGTPKQEVTQIFRDRDLVSAPVVDENGLLLGRINIDDVVDVIAEEAAHEVMSMAGLRDEEDVFAGVVPSTKRRIFWLALNLGTAFLAASVVRQFESTIAHVAALAALMPIVASMGGVAGTQTVTLIIRGLALGQVEWSNARWLLFKEIAVAGINGAALALVVSIATVAWFGAWKLALIIAPAMVINLLAAATVGTLLPLVLRRLRIDPALSAGVILTTFTDCIGFATLLGLGAIFLV